MTSLGMRLFLAGAITMLVAGGLAREATAQVSAQDKACINAFNKGIRKVAKAQGKIVKKCLSDYAAGRLVSTTPEDCVRSDPTGELNRAVVKAASKAGDKCLSLPPFGVTDIPTALAEAGVSQIDLIHEAVGANLDTDLMGSAVDATCQAKVGAQLLKCSDRRIREFVTCKKKGLQNGTITNAATLTNACLGTGASSQPDPSGRIALDCLTKVRGELVRCSSTNLQLAFSPCNPADANDAAVCLNRKSACEACLLLDDVDGLARDCDLFDDGDAGNGSCGRECPDGFVQEDESCDDNNSTDNDGCSSFCTVEGGWSCTGEPSVCTLKCGNSALDPGETCDDGDTDAGDGCSGSCLVESGYECTGAPSVCTLKCGNGDVETGEGEACDDDDNDNGDGCSSTCQVEPGYNCNGDPSVCVFVCGNGSFQNGETCDDGDAGSGDGCNGACQIETGWSCLGVPSVCSPVCGDALLRGAESCDDDNTLPNDGCSSICQAEAGFLCSGAPSNCQPVCGDGFIRGSETCDDADQQSGDGCSAPFCLRESSYACAGQPSVCVANCGDGNIDVPEQCDDGDLGPGDGCNGACQIEAGYACSGTPSVCDPTCGNSSIQAGETCDDGNFVSRDGCSAGCRNESGWLCGSPGQACLPFEIVIDSPANGVFTTAGSVLVSGHYTQLPAGQVAVTINGVPASSLNQTLRTFSHTVSVSQAAIFNPVRATLTYIANGDDVHDRIVVIAGPSVADGSFSPQSVAMRLNDSGLDSIEPLVSGLAAGQFDFATLLPAGTVLIDDCFISVIGCWGSAQVRIANPPPSIGSFQLFIDSKPNAVFGDIRVNNLRIDVDIDGSGLVPDCGLRLTANQLRLTGDYALEPLVSDPSNIDVNLATPLGITFTGFNDDFTSGLCDAPIIGDIIGALLPDIESAVTDGIRGFLDDPDGGGSADSPIADAIETVLAGISISGPVGAGVGLMFESPLFQVAEDNNGITLGSNSRFQVSVGSGPGQCIPLAGSPNLTASLSKPAPFPSFGTHSPVNNVPYGLGIAISSAGFNQLLRGQTECGLMRTSLTSIDLDGPGGNPPFAVTPLLLSLIIPEFSQLPPNLPLRIDIAPTIAPVVTGDAGPGGELTELRIAQVTLSIVEPGPETVWLRGALDAELGLNLTFNGTGLSIGLASPLPGDLRIAIIDNPLGANETQVEAVLPSLLQPLLPQLAGALSGFPLPEFFGLTLQGIEVSRSGQFLSLYVNLAP